MKLKYPHHGPKKGASETEVAELKNLYDQKSLNRDSAVQAYLEGSEFAGKVGAFEGAGYTTNGLYRPAINCIMFTRTDYFCPVCQDAMNNVLRAYAE
jgi:hypothetical protein